MRHVWLVTAAVACTKVPDEPILDRAPLITVTTESNTVQIRTAGYAIAFAPEGMVRMPETLTIGGSPNLFDTQDCPFETYVGIALFPVMVASAAQPAVASTLMRISDGPVIAKVAVTYDVASTCASVPRHLTGTTYFTFFPTGRINREDRMVSPTETEIPAATMCQECGAGGPSQNSEFYFTTFYNFSEGTYVTPAGSPAPTEPAPVQGCALTTGGFAIGVAWRNDNVGVGPRIQNGAYIHDWVRRQSGPLQPQVRSAFSDLVIPSRPSEQCAVVLQAAREVPLRFAGVAVPPGRDGIYRPSESGGGTSELELANPSDAAIPHGIAISLDLDEPDHISLRRGGAITDRWRLQPDFDDPARTILWIEDGIAPNETLVLEVD
jgi:hypothetical protein